MKFQYRLIILVLGVIFSLGISTELYSKEFENIEEILEHVSSSNQDLDSKKQIIKANISNKKLAKAIMLPDVSLKYYKTNNTHINFKLLHGTNFLSDYYNSNNIKLELTTNIFNGFKDVNNIHYSNAKYLKSVSIFDLTKQNIFYSTISTYYKIQKLFALRNVSSKELISYENKLKYLEINLKSKDSFLYDKYQTEININNTQNKIEIFNQNIRISTSNISELLPNLLKITIKYNAKFNIEDHIKHMTNSLNSIKNNIIKYVDDSPITLIQTHNKSQKKYLSKIKYGNFLPKVSVQAYAGYQMAEFIALGYSRNSYGFNFNVSIPVFSSFKNFHKYKESSYIESSASAKLHNTRSSIHKKILNNIDNFYSQLHIVNINKKTYLNAQRMYKAASIEFSNKHKDYFELLYFTNKLYQKQKELIKSQYKTISFYLKSLKYSGLLTTKTF